MATLAYIEDLDEMQHHAEFYHGAFHLGLHCLLRLKQPAEIEIHHNLETSSCDIFMYKLGNSILIVSMCMRNSIRIQRIK